MQLCFLLGLFFYSSAAGGRGLLPLQATDLARSVDHLIHFLVLISLAASVLVIAGFVWFAVRFKRKSETDKTPHITHHYLLEFLWSFIPLLIFMFVFAWGWWLYDDMRTSPAGALEIHVYGQMWNWDFVYKNGKKTAGTLYVPVHKPVKLVMTSRDVIHSFYIPAFRIKQDVLPQVYTSLSFTASKTGRFHVFCTEFCGTGHSRMLAQVRVMSLKDWEKWLKTDPYKGLSLTQIGESVFGGRCVACHQVTTESRIGPGLKGIFGQKRFFEDGTSLVADENYLRESILNPEQKIVKGYSNLMTPFTGLLQEEELTGLIEYIKSLNSTDSNPEEASPALKPEL